MDMEIKQGRAERFTIGPITTETGAMQDLTSRKLLWVVKTNEDDLDSAAELVYGVVVDGSGVPTSDGITFGRYVNGILQDDTVNSGYVTLEINDDDTRDMSGSYFYELAFVEGVRPYTLRSGTLTVVPTLIDDPETLVP